MTAVATAAAIIVAARTAAAAAYVAEATKAVATAAGTTAVAATAAAASAAVATAEGWITYQKLAYRLPCLRPLAIWHSVDTQNNDKIVNLMKIFYQNLWQV